MSDMCKCGQDARFTHACCSLPTIWVYPAASFWDATGNVECPLIESKGSRAIDAGNKAFVAAIRRHFFGPRSGRRAPGGRT